jgi:hypothetical protein
MLAGVAPDTVDDRIDDNASRDADRLGAARVADLAPARFSRLTDTVSGRRSNTSCLNWPE